MQVVRVSMGKAAAIVAKQADLEAKWSPPWACGPTSLLVALRLLGFIKVTFDDVLDAAGVSRRRQNLDSLLDQGRKVVGADEKAGLDQDQLAEAAAELGYRAVAVRHTRSRKAWRALARAASRHRPVLLSVDNSGHWVVVHGVDQDGAWVMDPGNDDEAFEYVERQDLLEWWWEDEDEVYFGLRIEPDSVESYHRMAHAGMPPSEVFFVHADYPRAEKEAVRLRETLGDVFEEIPQHRGRQAARVFDEHRKELVKAVCEGLCEVDSDWVEDQAELLEDLLTNLGYVVPNEHVDRFLVDCAYNLAVDALIAAVGEPWSMDEDELVEYPEDAHDALGGCRTGTSAQAFVQAHEGLLVERGDYWLAMTDRRALRRHLRGLAAATAGRPWGVPAARKVEALARLTVLMVAYAWYA